MCDQFLSWPDICPSGLFVTSCYELVVIILLTTSYVQTISDLLEQLVASLSASSTLLQGNNLFQTCQQLGTSSENTSCCQAVRFSRVYNTMSTYWWYVLDEAEDKHSRGLTEVLNWPESNPQHKVGQIAGVAVQTTGDVVVFHRGDRKWDLK